MSALLKWIAGVGFACIAMGAWAVPVQFDYYGTGDGVTYEGSLVIDDSLFNGGTVQSIAQSNLIGFSMNATNGTTFTWGLEDLNLQAVWQFDSSGSTPDIVGQGGYISYINDLLAAGTGVMYSTFGIANGDWTYAGPISAVPEPGILALLTLGLAGLAFARRRQQ